jgi:hypothetical protein
MKDLLEYQKQRIEALEIFNTMQQDLIDTMTMRIDELTFDYSNAQAKYNMLVRNIQVIDAIVEQPLN